MSLAAALAQLAGVILAPLAPGSIQTLKARLQGRRGTSPLQPYRTLWRLWHKSAVAPQGAGPAYRIAPPLIAACLLVSLAVVPVAGRGGGFGFGNDALALLGVLSLARLTLAAACWDTGSGFALMAVARELMLSVFGEALFLGVLLIAALPAQSTNLLAMSAAAAGGRVWSAPAHWCGAVAFFLVILLETGRQPVDNPDTHLELTMIHEGPLLEYAGRDLALLQWAGAARHWLVLVLGAELFLPHWGGFAAGLGLSVGAVAALCCLLAVVETEQAKMRILRIPGLLGLGCAVALAGAGMWVGGVGV